MTELRRVGIPFIRRRSGGGTVYHVGHLFVLFPRQMLKVVTLGPWELQLFNPPSTIFVRPERFRQGRITGCPISRHRRRERERAE